MRIFELEVFFIKQNMTGKINEEMTKFLQAGAMLPGRSFDPRDYKNQGAS